MRPLRTALIALALVTGPISASAQVNLGPQSCKECHDIEIAKWRETKHASTYSEFNKDTEATDIAASVGDSADPKENTVCQMCHYTVSRTAGSSTLKPRSGPSCESCHGASSGWLKVHRDYGGRQVSARDEPDEHKRSRIEDSKAAGMVWPWMRYDMASACYRCHAFTNPELATDTLKALLAAEHPSGSDFEFVRYSQGSIRHRYYPPDFDVNQEMSNELLARIFVVGQAAQIVHSQTLLDKLGEGSFVDQQRQKIERARQVLEKVGDIAEVRTFLGAPSEANARAVLMAIQELDLHPQVGSELPRKGDYK